MSSAIHALPGVREILDIQADGLDQSLTSTVLSVEGDTLRTTVGETESRRRVRLEPGTGLQLSWREGRTLLGMAAELVAVHLAGDASWEVRAAGPVTRGQRREAVRADLRLPVTVRAGGEEQPGTTLDVSEGGLRLLLDAAPGAADGTAPSAHGDRMQVTLDLDGQPLTGEARLVRRHLRTDERWEVSVAFTAATEHQQDSIRRRVFAELRAQAARDAR